MADQAQTAATPKKRRAQGPRNAKPLFAVVSYKDADGNSVALDKSRLDIKVERDAGKLLELVTSGDFGAATVVRIELPAPAQRAKADASASA
jgi:hypothetical protein